MVRRFVVPAWLLILAACLWWLGVFVYDFLRFTPNPSVARAWIDWRQMDAVYRMGPWLMLPFVLLALWRIGSRRMPASASLKWISGVAAFAWTAFVCWRAHQQSFNCAAWAPREEFWSTDTCFMPQLLGAVLPWLAIPIAAWLVFAASELPFLPKARSPRPLS